MDIDTDASPVMERSDDAPNLEDIANAAGTPAAEKMLGKVPTADDATADDMARLLADEAGVSQDEPVEEPAVEQPVELQEAPQAQPDQAQALPEIVGQAVSQALAPAYEAINQSLLQLQQTQAGFQQFMGGLMSAAQENRQQAQLKASMPKPPPADATPDEMNRYDFEMMKWNNQQEMERTVTPMMRELASIKQQLQAQQQQQQLSSSINSMKATIDQVASQPGNEFLRDEFVSEQMLHRIAFKRRQGDNAYGPADFAVEFRAYTDRMRGAPPSRTADQQRSTQVRRAQQGGRPGIVPLRSGASGSPAGKPIDKQKHAKEQEAIWLSGTTSRLR